MLFLFHYLTTSSYDKRCCVCFWVCRNLRKRGLVDTRFEEIHCGVVTAVPKELMKADTLHRKCVKKISAARWCVENKIAVINARQAFRGALEVAHMLEPSFQPADILQGISSRQVMSRELLMISDAIDLYYADKIEQARGPHSKYCLVFLAQTTCRCNAWNSNNILQLLLSPAHQPSITATQHLA